MIKCEEITGAIEEMAELADCYVGVMEHMKTLGWRELSENEKHNTKDGHIVHDNLGKAFDTWQEAIEACITVASE